MTQISVLLASMITAGWTIPRVREEANLHEAAYVLLPMTFEHSHDRNSPKRQKAMAHEDCTSISRISLDANLA